MLWFLLETKHRQKNHSLDKKVVELEVNITEKVGDLYKLN